MRWRGMGPWYAVQAAADRPPGHAPPGCAHWLTNAVPADHGWVVAEGPAPRHRTPTFEQRSGRLACGSRFRGRPVALPLLSCLQGEHRAFAACLAAPAP